MKTLLIGSRALKYWEPDFNLRESADWDIISHTRLEVHDERYEWHPASTLNNAFILESAGSGEFVEYCGQQIEVAYPRTLALIKRSHLWRDLNFDKHITMYTKWLRKYVPTGPYRSMMYNRVLNERIKLTEEKFPQHKISLNKTKDEFFDDYVVKKYDHDFLHELFAHYDRPLYERMQDKSIDSVFCHREMWESFSHDDKIKCIMEECYVIASERFLIPKDWEYGIRHAFYKALCKVCTTLTSGFFRDYAIDNFYEIMDNLDISKFEEVREKLQSVAPATQLGKPNV